MPASLLRAIVAVLFTLSSVPAFAGSISLVTNRADIPGSDGINWGTLGGDFTPLASPFDALTQEGGLVTVSGAPAFALFEGATYNADFLPTDIVLSLFDLEEFDVVSGAIRLTFDRPYWAVGAQIQSNFFGGFTAYLEAFDQLGVSYGLVSLNGTNNGDGDGSAPFLGVRSSLRDIWAVEFRLGDGMAINQVSMVPEPVTLGLVLLGAGVLGLRRRRRG
jgi:hypothetical protein